VFVPAIPPVRPGRLGGLHQGHPLAVEHVARTVSGLDPGQPIGVDAGAFGHLRDAHPGGQAQALQLLAGVGRFGLFGHNPHGTA